MQEITGKEESLILVRSKFDLSKFDLSKFDLSKFDLSKFDLSKFYLSKFNLSKFDSRNCTYYFDKPFWLVSSAWS